MLILILLVSALLVMNLLEFAQSVRDGNNRTDMAFASAAIVIGFSMLVNLWINLRLAQH